MLAGSAPTCHHDSLQLNNIAVVQCTHVEGLPEELYGLVPGLFDHLLHCHHLSSCRRLCLPRFAGFLQMPHHHLSKGTLSYKQHRCLLYKTTPVPFYTKQHMYPFIQNNTSTLSYQTTQVPFIQNNTGTLLYKTTQVPFHTKQHRYPFIQNNTGTLSYEITKVSFHTNNKGTLSYKTRKVPFHTTKVPFYRKRKDNKGTPLYQTKYPFIQSKS